MNILILKDTPVDHPKLEGVMREIASLYTTNTGITPIFHVEERDFSELEYSEYTESGALGIEKSYLDAYCKEVYSRWAEEIDLVIFLVHDKNWKPGDFNYSKQKVWGWNISNAYSGYQVEQCRWDPVREVNSVGTMYHEIMHSHDSFIYSYLGYWIHKMVGVTNWDEDCVHGRSDKWDYIRYKENQEALRAIREPLFYAFQKRREIFDKKVSKMRQTIQLLQQAVVLLNQLVVKQRKKDIPLLENNICTYGRNSSDHCSHYRTGGGG